MLNPFANNPLRSRSDMQEAVRELVAPLVPRFSPGGARVRVGQTGAHFPDSAAELEGFARPLWALAPLLAGGGAFEALDLYLQGLTHGSDPQHAEYWGEPRGQALVEMAPLGFALALAPHYFWEQLSPLAQQHLARWLAAINTAEVPDNNWLLFRVMANLGLKAVGAEGYSEQALKAALDRHDTFYLSDGWYGDGNTMQRDYYNTFVIHLIGLIYARLEAQTDPERSQLYKRRAAAFAPEFIHWFAADGAAIPFGRSLTYRFAQGNLWGALAFADVEALPWGVIKGLLLRHLRWWAGQTIFNNDGTLSIGYAYPNLMMAETYNSPGSPYWGMNAFLPLALPETHPFWQAEEAPLPELPAVQLQAHPHMLVCRAAPRDHLFVLSSGQHDLGVRHGEAKYAKFAYSTRFGFSVPSSQYGLAAGAYDSMLALSDDGQHFRAREAPLEAKILDNTLLYARWLPWSDAGGTVEVETWLAPALPWHIRVHRLRTARKLYTAEGGFALDRTEFPTGQQAPTLYEQDGLALAVYQSGWSGLRVLSGGQSAQPARAGQVVSADPNTNLLYQRTVIPTLLSEYQPGEHILICAVCAGPATSDPTPFWNDLPEVTRTEQAISLSYHGQHIGTIHLS